MVKRMFVAIDRIELEKFYTYDAPVRIFTLQVGGFLKEQNEEDKTNFFQTYLSYCSLISNFDDVYNCFFVNWLPSKLLIAQ